MKTRSKTKISGIRNSTEYNCMEFVLPLLILYNDIVDYNTLLKKLSDFQSNIIIFNKETDLNNYKQDIYNKENIIINYIKVYRSISHIRLQNTDILFIYISGKTNKHKKIIDLNTGLDKKYTKSDIYIEYNNGLIIGISVKQKSDVTKSNYSVQKILGKEVDTILTNIKKTYLNNNGITSFKKSERQKINELFYKKNTTNIYWLRLKEEIKINNKLILDNLIKYLYCLDVKYEIYEFDGKTFEQLNDIKIINSSFLEHDLYYLKNNGSERETAKLFYRLIINEKKYRVEIRWKGNIYNSSPQFLIHNDN
jgi:hypothetical protein